MAKKKVDTKALANVLDAIAHQGSADPGFHPTYQSITPQAHAAWMDRPRDRVVAKGSGGKAQGVGGFWNALRAGGGKALGGALNVVDTPRAAITALSTELAQKIQPDDAGPKGKGSFHDFFSEVYHPKQRVGFGDIVYGNKDKGLTETGLGRATKGNKAAKLAVGLAGDIVLDPLTYLAPGKALASIDKIQAASRVAEVGGREVKALEAAGKIAEASDHARTINTIVQRASRKGVSSLSHAERQRYLGLTAQEAKGGLKLNVPGTGRLGRTITNPARKALGREALHESVQTGLIPEALTHPISNALNELTGKLGDVRAGSKAGAALSGSDADLKAAIRGLTSTSKLGSMDAANVLREKVAIRTAETTRKQGYLKVVHDAMKGLKKGEREELVNALHGGEATSAKVIEAHPKVRAAYDLMREEALAAGVDIPKQENYFPGLLDQKTQDVLGIGDAKGGARQGKNSFERRRTLLDPNSGSVEFLGGKVDGATPAERIKQIDEHVNEYIKKNPDMAHELGDAKAMLFSNDFNKVTETYARRISNRIEVAQAAKRLEGFGVGDARGGGGAVSSALDDITPSAGGAAAAPASPAPDLAAHVQSALPQEQLDQIIESMRSESPQRWLGRVNPDDIGAAKAEDAAAFDALSPEARRNALNSGTAQGRALAPGEIERLPLGQEPASWLQSTKAATEEALPPEIERTLHEAATSTGVNVADQVAALPDTLKQSATNMVRALKDARGGIGGTSRVRLQASIEDLVKLAGTTPADVGGILGAPDAILPGLRDTFENLLDPSKKYDALRRQLFDAAKGNIEKQVQEQALAGEHSVRVAQDSVAQATYSSNAPAHARVEEARADTFKADLGELPTAPAEDKIELAVAKRTDPDAAAAVIEKQAERKGWLQSTWDKPDPPSPNEAVATAVRAVGDHLEGTKAIADMSSDELLDYAKQTLAKLEAHDAALSSARVVPEEWQIAAGWEEAPFHGDPNQAIEDAAAHVRKSVKVTTPLTGAEHGAIDTYSQTSSAIQQALRAEGAEPSAIPHVAELDSAIAKSTTKRPLHVYRVTGSNVADLTPGSVHVEPAFTSVTMLEDAARSLYDPEVRNGAIWHISMPKGTNVADVSGDISKGESELILARNQSFRIESVGDVDGVPTVHVTLVPSDPKVASGLMAKATEPERVVAKASRESLAREYDWGQLVPEPDPQIKFVAATNVTAERAGRLIDAAHAPAEGTGLDQALTGKVNPADFTERVRSELAKGLKTTLHRDIATPQDVADHLNDLQRVGSPEAMRGFLAKYDKLLTYIKAGQIGTPGFHVRNFVGGAFNNELAGMEFSSYGKWEKLIHGAERAGGRASTLKPEEQILHDTILSSIGFGQIGSETHTLENPGLRRFNPLSQDFQLFRSSHEAGGQVEKRLRGALAHDTITKASGYGDAMKAALSGDTTALDSIAQRATERVARFHFDYQDLSNFERNTVKRVVPFYTWTRKNVPLQLEMMVRNPKVDARVAQFKNNVEMQSEPDATTPSYFSNDFNIRLPFTLHGGHLYGNAGIPLNDLTNSDPGAYGSMVSPILKTPFEMWAGHQVWNGLPLTGKLTPASVPFQAPGIRQLLVASGKGKVGKDGQLYMADRDSYVAEQYLPILGRLRRLAPNDPKYQDRANATWVNFVFGGGLKPNTRTQQAGVLKGSNIQSSRDKAARTAQQRQLGFLPPANR